MSAFAPENLASRDGFGSPVPRQPAHLHTQAKSGAYLRDSPRVPRRRPYTTTEDDNGAGDIWGTTVRNEDEESETLWESIVWGITRRVCETYLVTLTDRCSFLCVSGQRGTIAKSMYEEHLCVIALTSIERGTQFFLLVSYFLV